jgi:hypothetical protein
MVGIRKRMIIIDSMVRKKKYINIKFKAVLMFFPANGKISKIRINNESNILKKLIAVTSSPA